MTRQPKPVHQAWDAAREWHKPYAYTKIKNAAQLKSMKIRELKHLVAGINEQLGLIIGKPLAKQLGITRLQKKSGTQEGITYSVMRKDELIKCITRFKSVLGSRPQEEGKWNLRRLSKRVYSFSSPTGVEWVHYVGFQTEQEAYKQYQYMLEKGKCTMACLRSKDRTEFAWEVKYWGLNPDTLVALLNMDTPLPITLDPTPVEEIPAVQEVPPIVLPPYSNIIQELFSTSVEEIEDRTETPEDYRDRYQTLYNGAPNFFRKRILEDPMLELVGDTVWLKRDFNSHLCEQIRQAAAENSCFIVGEFNSLFRNAKISFQANQTIGQISYGADGKWRYCTRPQSAMSMPKEAKENTPQACIEAMLDAARIMAF